MNDYTEKDINFIRSAKDFANRFCTCLSSRKIGVLVVKGGQVIGEGVNGPPKKVLHIEDSYIKVDEKTVIFGRGWFYSKTLKQWIKLLDYHKDDPKQSVEHHSMYPACLLA